METLPELFAKLGPVLAFIPVGYFLKWKFAIKPEYVSGPLIKMFLPFLVFFNVLDADTEKLYILPVMTFILALTMNPVASFAHKRFASDTNPLLLKSAFSFFNIAFFGIPIVTALFGKEEVSMLMCIYLGSALYGDTIGYFQVAKTKLSAKDAMKKVLSIPFLYVFVAAVICKSLGVETPDFLEKPLDVVSFIVSAAGMTIVGFQLADVDGKDLKLGYYLKMIGFRSLVAAAVLAILVLAERLMIDKLEENDIKMLALVPLFPVAANVTVFASFLKAEEKQSALLVFLSTVVSLVLVTLAVILEGVFK